MDASDLHVELRETGVKRGRPDASVGLMLVVAAACLSFAAGGAGAQEPTEVPATVEPAVTDCPATLEPTASSCGGGPADPGAAPGASLPSTWMGNPISLVTGVKSQRETDYAIDGAPLRMTRHYSSAMADTDIGLGHGWRHSFLVTLASTADGGRLVTDSSGREVRFGAAEPGAASATGDPVLLAASLASDGYLLVPADAGDVTVWVVPDGRRLGFRGSYLVSIDWPDQRALTLYYRERRLARVTDETGRRLRFEYTPGYAGLAAYDASDDGSQPGHLSAVVLPDGSRIAYTYDGQRNLASARFADGTMRRYHYEDAAWPSHLTGLTERTGTRFASWTYDERGRATSSSHAGGVERVTLAIEAPEDVPGGRTGDEGRTTVLDSGGAESVYRWRRDPRTGASQLLSSDGAGCATCPPTGRRYGYDEHGLLTNVTRFGEDGRTLGTTRYLHDERGRRVQVEETRVATNGTDVKQITPHQSKR